MYVHVKYIVLVHFTVSHMYAVLDKNEFNKICS